MTDKPNSLEIPIISPSSPLVPLQIHDFVKDINVTIDTKVNTNTPTITGGGGSDTGILGYFKSFFQRFSQSSNQQKKQEAQNTSSLQKLFYSGDGNKIENNKTEENEKNEKTEENEKNEKTEENEENEKTEENEENEENEKTEENEEITKIIITTTEDPNIVLRESLKGTKLYYFTERTEEDLPSQWV